MEAFGLGVFMLSACLFTTLLFSPWSPIGLRVMDGVWRRALMGVAMALTAVAIIYSPWGKRSGAHINPSVTLTFLRLGKVAPWDAAFYILFQFLGALGGVLLAALVLGSRVASPSVDYAVTTPGPFGPLAALGAEAAISFLLMTVILVVSNAPKFARFTGLFAGLLIALYITFEAPVSGMSMNPARTVGSAVFAHVWTGLWIYFVAPPLGMLLAAELYQRALGPGRVFCAKLHHDNRERCIHCLHAALKASLNEERR